jgi:hypothetical protein
VIGISFFTPGLLKNRFVLVKYVGGSKKGLKPIEMIACVNQRVVFIGTGFINGTVIPAQAGTSHGFAECSKKLVMVAVILKRPTFSALPA